MYLSKLFKRLFVIFLSIFFFYNSYRYLLTSEICVNIYFLISRQITNYSYNFVYFAKNSILYIIFFYTMKNVDKSKGLNVVI